MLVSPTFKDGFLRDEFVTLGEFFFADFVIGALGLTVRFVVVVRCGIVRVEPVRGYERRCL